LEHEEKRSDDILPFVAELDRMGVNYSFVIAGQGSGEVSLRARLASQVSSGRIRFEGWRTRDELYSDVYPNLDCLLVFSASEAGPLALWEAMAHGVVAVSSRYCGAAAEGTLRHRVTALLFAVGDVAGAALGVAELTRDSDLFETLSRRGRQTVEERYSLEAHGRGWLRAFEGALEGPALLSDLPGAALAASGRLERMGVPPWAASLARAALGRRPRAAGPGDEWPHCAPWPAEALGSVQEAVVRLDRPT
jgi:glycosyltransferase involved in cell wall biosynthesis